MLCCMFLLIFYLITIAMCFKLGFLGNHGRNSFAPCACRLYVNVTGFERVGEGGGGNCIGLGSGMTVPQSATHIRDGHKYLWTVCSPIYSSPVGHGVVALTNMYSKYEPQLSQVERGASVRGCGAHKFN
jgi:hypothetical protein